MTDQPLINGHPFQAGTWIMRNGEEAEMFAVRGDFIYGRRILRSELWGNTGYYMPPDDVMRSLEHRYDLLHPKPKTRTVVFPEHYIGRHKSAKYPEEFCIGIIRENQVFFKPDEWDFIHYPAVTKEIEG